jgi:hypothetical protein
LKKSWPAGIRNQGSVSVSASFIKMSGIYGHNPKYALAGGWENAPENPVWRLASHGDSKYII